MNTIFKHVNDPRNNGAFAYNARAMRCKRAVLGESNMLDTFIYFPVWRKTNQHYICNKISSLL